MVSDCNHLFSQFFVFGINYRKTDIETRGTFSVCPDKYQVLVNTATQYRVEHFFVLSTCNRTEIFGFAADPAQLGKLLCSVSEGNYQDISRLSYVKKDMDAVLHLFRVAAGLDSQILGDYEITGQIKQAVKFSRSRGCISAPMERLINEVLQASKKIRTETSISSGTVSVSFAAIQYIQQKLGEARGKNILLVGTGKMGTNTCKNLVDYLPGNTVRVVNRTASKSLALAQQFNLNYVAIEDLDDACREADVILVTTHSAAPLINFSNISGIKPQLLIDLSVPANIDKNVIQAATVSLVTVDDLARIKDETLLMRQQEIPKVLVIIEEGIKELHCWCLRRKYAPALKAARLHLEQLHTTSVSSYEIPSQAFIESTVAAEDKIQKAINGMAIKMQAGQTPGCHCIEAMNEFISLS